MNDNVRKPLVLIVEDINEWMKILRRLLKPLDCRLEIRKTVADAFDFADSHDAGSADPIDLVILDWRVPDKPGAVVDEEAKVQGGMKYLRRYNYVSSRASIIVFTAYPSYDDCIEAIHEGADYYLPKSEPGAVDNSQKLLGKCREFLTKSKGEPKEDEPSSPSDAWFKRNHKNVRERHAGKFVAFIPGGETFSIDPAGSVSVNELDGVEILVANTQKELRRCIQHDATLRKLLPLITYIEGSGR